MIIPLPPNHDIAGARGCATTLAEFATTLLHQATHTLVGVRKARTLENLVLRHARFLGVYHGGQIAFNLAFRQIDSERMQPGHREAVAAIRTAIDEIRLAVAGPHPWLSLPNLDRTRFNAERVLLQIITSSQAIIDASAVLNGERRGDAA